MADADVTPPAARAHCPHSEAFVIKTRVTRDQHLPDSGLKAWLVYRTSADPVNGRIAADGPGRRKHPIGTRARVAAMSSQAVGARYWAGALVAGSGARSYGPPRCAGPDPRTWTHMGGDADWVSTGLPANTLSRADVIRMGYTAVLHLGDPCHRFGD